MISSLIPIYNFDVRTFVRELHSQFERQGIRYEILLADDASEESYRVFNSELNELPNVKYIQLLKNIGRASIRNYLADQAQFTHLMFADCDSEIPSIDFVKNYLLYVKKDIIVCGGRTYRKEKPDDSEELLRWYYGSKRESSVAELRNNYPMRSFMTNNYLIPKEIHQKIRFDEKIMNYGHEDTLFGIELKRAGYSVLHINNPLVHIGLEPSVEFIQKTKHGIENLIYLNENYKYPELDHDIKILRVNQNYAFLRPIFRLTYMLFSKLMLKNLTGKRPTLMLFDLYKIAYLAYFQYRERKK